MVSIFSRTFYEMSGMRTYIFDLSRINASTIIITILLLQYIVIILLAIYLANFYFTLSFFLIMNAITAMLQAAPAAQQPQHHESTAPAYEIVVLSRFLFGRFAFKVSHKPPFFPFPVVACCPASCGSKPTPGILISPSTSWSSSLCAGNLIFTAATLRCENLPASLGGCCYPHVMVS